MYTGLTGKIKIGVASAGEVAYISNWSVENSAEIIEFAELGVSTRHKTSGMKGWTASADGTVMFGGDGCHKQLFDAMNNGDKVNCEFYLNDDTKFSGEALIESLSVDLAAEDKGNISISLSGIGILDLDS